MELTVDVFKTNACARISFLKFLRVTPKKVCYFKDRIIRPLVPYMLLYLSIICVSTQTRLLYIEKVPTSYIPLIA